MNKQIEMIDVEKIYPHPDNPRKNIGDVGELADSIKVKGILQNLTVVPRNEGGYTVIIGHRRLAAAKAAGLIQVPCVIAEDMSYREQIGTMLLENVQRSDLTIMEQANGFQMMLDLGETQKSISEKTGFSEATVSRRIKLVKMDAKKVLEAEKRGGTIEQYIKVADIKDKKKQGEVLNAIGTGDFDRQLKVALSEQKRKENMPGIRKELKFAEEVKDSSARWCGKYREVKWIDAEKWTPGTFDIKIDADKKYIWYDYYGTIYLCTAIPNANKGQKLSEEEKKARRLRARLRKLTAEFYEMRKEFIKEFFKSGRKQEGTVNVYMYEYMMFDVVNPYVYAGNFDEDLLAEMMGIDTYDVDKDQFAKFDEKYPGSAKALCLYCAMGDGESKGYFRENCGSTMPSHERNKLLDLIYDYLESLGYDLCTEEKELRNGTHPLLNGKEE